MAIKLKSAFRPSERKRRSPTTLELDLTPIMNLVVVLIPMLLQVVAFIKISQINYQVPESTPSAGEGIESVPKEEPTEPDMLNLVVNVIDTSIEISIFKVTEGENYYSIPLLPDSSYDFGKLQEILLAVKEDVVGEPTENEPLVGPDGKPIIDSEGKPVEKAIYKYKDAEIVRIGCWPDLPYQDMVTLLDVTRTIEVDGKDRWLFPTPVLGIIGI